MTLSTIDGWRNLSIDELAARLASLPKEDRDQIAREASSITAEDRFIPNVGPQTTAFFSQADVCLYGGAAGGGKMLDLDEVLATPRGWTRVGDIIPGDALFDEGGALCRVLAISPIESRKTYRLTFDDGSAVTCCSEHGWLTYDAKELGDLLKRSAEWRAKRRAARPSVAKGNKSAKFSAAISARNAANAKGGAPPCGTIRTTQQIVDTLLTKRGRRNHAVPVAGPIDLPEVDLPLDPYVLGAWLGDGTTTSAGFTGIDAQIWEEIERAGFEVTHSANGRSHYIRGLSPILRRIGLLGRKAVPPEYLRGSIRQRLRLLQGLMDTDGHAAVDGGCEFDNTDGAIIDAVYELVTSLGIKASLQEGLAKLNGRVIGPKWRVKFVTTIPVFLLERKAARMRAWARQTTRFRYIVDAIEIDPLPMRCIEVDSPSHLYLCSKAFIPTHNSSLILGLALTQHERSLIMRQQYNDLDALTEELIKLYGSRKGFNGSNPPSMKTEDGRFIQFSGAVKDQWQGHPFDFKSADECSQIEEGVIRYHIGWLRSVKAGQRKRVLLCSNPPIDERGQYLLGMFRPWLDPTHPKPAKDGELRWYVRTPDDVDLEVDGPEPVQFPGEDAPPVEPMSRTFIRARLRDNPYLSESGYRKSLDQMEEPYRSAMRDGNFFAVQRDKPDQVIPVAWIKEAQARWTSRPPPGQRMTALGLDVGQGGLDRVVAAPLYGFWFDHVKVAKGKDAPDGPSQAAFAERYRRDGAWIVVDVGGGFGGDACSVFKSNKTPHERFNGAAEGLGKAMDGSGRGFQNKRAQALWRFREALNPDQPGGSQIALPPDPEITAELSAPMLLPDKRDIWIEPKKDIRTRLGRSMDKGDAIVMAWYGGQKATKRADRGSGWSQPDHANVGYAEIKRIGRQ